MLKIKSQITVHKISWILYLLNTSQHWRWINAHCCCTQCRGCPMFDGCNCPELAGHGCQYWDMAQTSFSENTVNSGSSFYHWRGLTSWFRNFKFLLGKTSFFFLLFLGFSSCNFYSFACPMPSVFELTTCTLTIPNLYLANSWPLS
jgi:hypothetical protein